LNVKIIYFNLFFNLFIYFYLDLDLIQAFILRILDEFYIRNKNNISSSTTNFDNEKKRDNIKNPIFLVNNFFSYTLKGQFISIFEIEGNIEINNNNPDNNLRTSKKSSFKSEGKTNNNNKNDNNIEIDKICEKIESNNLYIK
jgi:hypothetical protein